MQAVNESAVKLVPSLSYYPGGRKSSECHEAGEHVFDNVFEPRIQYRKEVLAASSGEFQSNWYWYWLVTSSSRMNNGRFLIDVLNVA